MILGIPITLHLTDIEVFLKSTDISGLTTSS